MFLSPRTQIISLLNFPIIKFHSDFIRQCWKSTIDSNIILTLEIFRLTKRVGSPAICLFIHKNEFGKESYLYSNTTFEVRRCWEWKLLMENFHFHDLIYKHSKNILEVISLHTPISHTRIPFFFLREKFSCARTKCSSGCVLLKILSWTCQLWVVWRKSFSFRRIITLFWSSNVVGLEVDELIKIIEPDNFTHPTHTSRIRN